MKSFLGKSLVLFVFATQLTLADDVLPFAAELDACVAAVNARLDLSDVHRVRHTVIEEKRTGIGYALSIDTAVYSTESRKRYSAYCVVRGGEAPLKFEFSEAD